MQEAATKSSGDESKPFDHGKLWKRLGGDLAAAAISGALVAPPVTIIDRALVETLANRTPMSQGLRRHTAAALRRPAQLVFSRPFGIVWALYATTYAVANSSDTLANEFHRAAVGTITFVSTMIFNVPMGVWKDLRFAQIYGANVPTGAKPPTLTPVKAGISKSATATFLIRDAVTIFGSFTMAPSMTEMIPDSLASSDHTKHMITQLTVPVLSQLVATPVHLLGLDFHNRQHKIGLGARFQHIRRDLPSATVVRCLRIIPAFGFGCIANQEIRSSLHGLAEES